MSGLSYFLWNKNRQLDKSRGNLISNDVTVDYRTANGVLKCLNNSVEVTSNTTSRSSFQEITSYTCSGEYIALITKVFFSAQPIGTYTTDSRFLGNLPSEIFLRMENLTTGVNGALAPIAPLTNENPNIEYDFSQTPIRLHDTLTIQLMTRAYPYQESGANNAGTIRTYGSIWLYLMDKTSQLRGETRFDFNNSIGLS